jgi:hypothetical protein
MRFSQIGKNEFIRMAMTRVLGEEHPETLKSMNNLAEDQFARGLRAGATVADRFSSQSSFFDRTPTRRGPRGSAVLALPVCLPSLLSQLGFRFGCASVEYRLTHLRLPVHEPG